MEKGTKMANRYGLDFTLTKIGELEATPIKIDFCNSVAIEMNGEITWATGGQGHVNRVAFKDPLTGTITASTQLVNMEVLALLADQDVSKVTDTVSFKNDPFVASNYYKLEGTTVWKDEQGKCYLETITAHKVFVRPNYSVTHDGSGDPVSLDLVFEMSEAEDGNFFDIKLADKEE